MTVLVIDDDPRVARLVEQLLKDEPDLEVLAAEDGASGLRQAAIHTPDLALVDWMLPDVDGIDVVAEMLQLSGSFSPMLRWCRALAVSGTFPLNATSALLAICLNLFTCSWPCTTRMMGAYSSMSLWNALGSI